MEDALTVLAQNDLVAMDLKASTPCAAPLPKGPVARDACVHAGGILEDAQDSATGHL